MLISPEEFKAEYPDLEVKSSGQRNRRQTDRFVLSTKGYSIYGIDESINTSDVIDKYPDITEDIKNLQPYLNAFRSNASKAIRSNPMLIPKSAFKASDIKEDRDKYILKTEVGILSAIADKIKKGDKAEMGGNCVKFHSGDCYTIPFSSFSDSFKSLLANLLNSQN